MSLSVIIPSRNSDNLEPCVLSIRAAGEDCRIIVIDDGLSRRPPGCEYLDGIKPFVYSRNVNRGINAAGTDDCIVTNDDALLESAGGFAAMQRASERHSEYGVI